MQTGKPFPTLLPEQYDIHDLQDEIRVDRLCVELLQRFTADQMEHCGQSPLEAGSRARGADYFLREFLIPECHSNLFRLAPERIRQFAGNWYIIRNLEPNLAELEAILAGVSAFYDFLARQRLYPDDRLTAVAAHCTDLEFYRLRIETFWAIEGDGYRQWQAACPLEPPDRSA